MSLPSSLSGLKVAILGGGRAGLSAARLAAREGARILVLDDGEAGRDAAAELGYDAGPIRADAIELSDVALLSPGVPRAHPEVARAIQGGARLYNEVELAAARLPDTTWLAVTGTNGKSTTTTLLESILQAHDPRCRAGGNLGTPACDFVLAALDGEDPPPAVALELSSYQLETIEDLPLQAAVVTNLAPDHLDRYDSLEAYYAAKARILDLVTAEGGASLNAADGASRAHLRAKRRCRAFDFDVAPGFVGVAIEGETLVVRAEAAGEGEAERVRAVNPALVGRHNLCNAAAAVAAAALAGVPPGAWQRGLDAWPGIPHRLELLGEHAGLRWFNDSKATNVDAAVTAVQSFDHGVHLIAGGVGKGAPYAPLVEAARGRLRGVYTIGEDAPAIASAFAGAAEINDCKTLEAAVSAIQAAARPGEVLLLSPACASFDQFKNYVVRGDALRALFEAARGGEG